MVAHTALCIHPAQTGARVLTLAVDAGLILWTVRVDNTLRAAVRWRADHFWQARALTAVTDNTGWVGVGSAWVGLTWVNVHRFNS